MQAMKFFSAVACFAALLHQGLAASLESRQTGDACKMATFIGSLIFVH
jgi:hypothetical protein